MQAPRRSYFSVPDYQSRATADSPATAAQSNARASPGPTKPRRAAGQPSVDDIAAGLNLPVDHVMLQAQFLRASASTPAVAVADAVAPKRVNQGPPPAVQRQDCLPTISPALQNLRAMRRKQQQQRLRRPASVAAPLGNKAPTAPTTVVQQGVPLPPLKTAPTIVAPKVAAKKSPTARPPPVIVTLPSKGLAYPPHLRCSSNGTNAACASAFSDLARALDSAAFTFHDGALAALLACEELRDCAFSFPPGDPSMQPKRGRIYALADAVEGMEKASREIKRHAARMRRMTADISACAAAGTALQVELSDSSSEEMIEWRDVPRLFADMECKKTAEAAEANGLVASEPSPIAAGPAMREGEKERSSAMPRRPLSLQEIEEMDFLGELALKKKETEAAASAEARPALQSADKSLSVEELSMQCLEDSKAEAAASAEALPAEAVAASAGTRPAARRKLAFGLTFGKSGAARKAQAKKTAPAQQKATPLEEDQVPAFSCWGGLFGGRTRAGKLEHKAETAACGTSGGSGTAAQPQGGNKLRRLLKLGSCLGRRA